MPARYLLYTVVLTKTADTSPKAKAKASVLAELAGGTLGQVIRVKEQPEGISGDYSQFYQQPYAATVLHFPC